MPRGIGTERCCRCALALPQGRQGFGKGFADQMAQGVPGGCRLWFSRLRWIGLRGGLASGRTLSHPNRGALDVQPQLLLQPDDAFVAAGAPQVALAESCESRQAAAMDPLLGQTLDQIALAVDHSIH